MAFYEGEEQYFRYGNKRKMLSNVNLGFNFELFSFIHFIIPLFSPHSATFVLLSAFLHLFLLCLPLRCVPILMEANQNKRPITGKRHFATCTGLRLGLDSTVQHPQLWLGAVPGGRPQLWADFL